MDFPNVRCDRHPESAPAPGYAVCVHVVDGAPIACYIPPTSRKLGVVVCDPCETEIDDLDHSLLVLMCGRCVNVLLADRAPYV